MSICHNECVFVQSFRKQKGEVAQVIAAYEATSTEQLSLTRGQLIMIRKKTDSGWWEGELQARGRRRQIGWFPATYVKVLQSGRLSGRSTPVSGGKIQMNEAVLGEWSRSSIICGHQITDKCTICLQTK